MRQNSPASEENYGRNTRSGYYPRLSSITYLRFTSDYLHNVFKVNIKWQMVKHLVEGGTAGRRSNSPPLASRLRCDSELGESTHLVIQEQARIGEKMMGNAAKNVELTSS
jgi:hypothetical protein